MSTVTSAGRALRRLGFDWPRHAPTVALVPFAAYTAAALAWFAVEYGGAGVRGRVQLPNPWPVPALRADVRMTPMTTMTPTFVLVHGSNGNASNWSALQRELALLGHRSLAVDLPGHGFGATFPAAYQAPQDLAALATAPSAMAGVTLADNVDHVAGVLRRAAEHGPVILVGHSRGGVTLTAVGNAVPDLVDRIVYMSAWCCVDLTPGEYMRGPEYASSALGGTMGLLVGDPMTLGAIRMNWRTADPGLLAALRTAMLADGTEDDLHSFLNTLEPDESLDAGGPDDRAQAATWGRIPRTYVRLTEDRSIPVSLQDRFIAEADALTPDNPFQVHSLDSSHVGFLIRPGQAAKILAGLAGAGPGGEG
ncbi:alpha/beta hydrolase [Actinopolymorpha singaporensis]